jgi:hypothetical protein
MRRDVYPTIAEAKEQLVSIHPIMEMKLMNLGVKKWSSEILKSNIA